MKNKISKCNLLNMDAVEVYKLVLDGTLNRFPQGFWDSKESLDNASKCVRYLIEDVLKWNEEDLLKNMYRKVFVKYKLKGMLTVLFKDVTFEALNNAYPNKFKPWQFNYVPNGYWENEDNCKKALLWLIDEKLEMTKEDIMEKWSMPLIKEYGLESLVKNKFRRSPYLALNFAKPGIFKPADLKCTSKGYWDNEENVKEYLIETFKTRKELTDDDILNLSYRDMYNNGFSTLIKRKGYTMDKIKDIIIAG